MQVGSNFLKVISLGGLYIQQLLLKLAWTAEAMQCPFLRTCEPHIFNCLLLELNPKAIVTQSSKSPLPMTASFRKKQDQFDHRCTRKITHASMI